MSEERSSPRREGDSNPRGSSPNGFQDRRIRPLCHPSAGDVTVQRGEHPENSSQIGKTARSPESVLESVSDAADGDDPRRALGPDLDLGAQPVDECREHLRADVGSGAPDVLTEDPPSKNAPGTIEQDLEETELLSWQLNKAAVHEDFVLCPVKVDITHLEDRIICPCQVFRRGASAWDRIAFRDKWRSGYRKWICRDRLMAT